MKILVVGGQDYKNYFNICRIFDLVHHNKNITYLVCKSRVGVENLAVNWAANLKPVDKRPQIIYDPNSIEIDLILAFPGYNKEELPNKRLIEVKL